MHPECAEWRGGVSDVDSQLPQGAFQSIPPPPQVFLESRAPHGSRTARVNRHHMSRRAWDESSTRGTVGSPSHIGEPCSLYAGARGPISYPQHARFKPFNAGNSQAHSCPPKCPSPPPSTSTSDISFHALGGSPIDTQSDFAVLELKASGGPRERTPVGRLSRSKSPLSMVTTSDGFYNVSSLNQSDPEDDIVPPIPKHFAASASSSVCPSVGSEIPLVNAEVPGSNEIQQLGSGDDGIRNEKR